MKTPPRRTLLVCVDMQPAFLRVMADGARVRRSCAFAVSAARGLGLPVLFTEQVPEKLGGTAPGLLALAPGATVLGKRTFSALADELIRRSLIRHLLPGKAVPGRPPDRRGHLLLCGVETPVCVYQTAVAAIAEGFEVTVLSDAVGARRPDDARVCLDALVRSGAHVLPTETVFYALLHDAGHPFFKAYTELVKSQA